jgi:hypothetical protein
MACEACCGSRVAGEPEKDGYYKLGFETEADVLGGDADFDDAYVYAKPLNEKLADIYIVKGSTGRELTLHDWRGATLEANFSTTAHYQQPLLNGSFGMNLSAAVPGMKPVSFRQACMNRDEASGIVGCRREAAWRTADENQNDSSVSRTAGETSPAF